MAQITYQPHVQVLQQSAWHGDGSQRYYVLEAGQHWTHALGALGAPRSTCFLGLGKGATLTLTTTPSHPPRSVCLGANAFMENLTLTGAGVMVPGHCCLAACHCTFSPGGSSSSTAPATDRFAAVWGADLSAIDLHACSVLDSPGVGVLARGNLRMRDTLVRGSRGCGVAALRGGRLLAERCKILGNGTGIDLGAGAAPGFLEK